MFDSLLVSLGTGGLLHPLPRTSFLMTTYYPIVWLYHNLFNQSLVIRHLGIVWNFNITNNTDEHIINVCCIFVQLFP